ncbi:hypothetical protein ACFQX6_50340 [Streptosporangium lutulentum]
MLLRTVTSPGIVEANKADQVVSVGAARVKSIRQVNSASVVFVVVGTQNVTAKSGVKERVEEYAVTLIEVGTDWRVHDLQPRTPARRRRPARGDRRNGMNGGTV